MSTPFAAYANATLTFQRAIAAPTVDALGNQSVQTEDFVVTAYLKEIVPRAGGNLSPFDGGTDTSSRVEGRLVEPTSLPADIVPGVRAIAVIGGIEGEFYLAATIPDAFGVDGVLGSKIKGRFVTRVAFGEAL